MDIYKVHLNDVSLSKITQNRVCNSVSSVFSIESSVSYTRKWAGTHLK